MSNTMVSPASLQPPAPPPNALDTTPGADPTQPVVHYQLSSGHVASLPQSSVPALLQQDKGAKQIPSPIDGEVLVQLSSGHTATLPSTSLSALKQQDPNYKYIAGDAPAVFKQVKPNFDAISAVAGPTTALGTPMSPAMQQEGSGVSDVLHGNFRQGASKIWAAEEPHVIKGSLVEKAMQKIDPTFQGSVSPAENDAALATRPIAQPAVDAAQFIDKDTHPSLKALTETAQGLTSPANIAILYSTGGLGLVDSPAAMGIASKLISSGFSAVAIADAYKHYRGFREAVDSGNSSEAEYQITHAVTSGVLGVLAAKDPVESAFKSDAVTAAAQAASKMRVNPFRRPVEIAGEDLNSRPVLSGANQDAATQVVRNIANKTSDTAGGLPASRASSLRDVFDAPIAAKEAAAKELWRPLDEASNNTWSANENALKNIRRDIQTKGGLNSENDAAMNAKKIQYEMQQEQIIDKAVKDGMPADAADRARSAWISKSRLEDVQDIFNKKSNVSGIHPDMATPGVKGLPAETYNFKGIAKDLNAMDPADLTAALGQKGAQNLVTTVNLAAKKGLAEGKAVAAIKGVLTLMGAGHVGAVAHLIS